MSEMTYVLAASYDDVEDALADLVVVYGPDMADQMAVSVTAGTRVRATTSMSVEQIADEIRARESGATAVPRAD
jgi:hypothetical protein